MDRQVTKEYLYWSFFWIAILGAVLFFLQAVWVDTHTYQETYKTTVIITNKKQYTTTEVYFIKTPRYHIRDHYEVYYEAEYKGIKTEGMINNYSLYNQYSIGDKEKALMIVRYYANNTDKEGQIYGTPNVEVSWRY